MPRMFADQRAVIRAKVTALDAYVKWKIEKLLPKVQSWADEGCDQPEIERRLEAMKDEVLAEAEGTMRCVTIAALQDGANDNG